MSKSRSNIAQYHLHKAHPEKLQFEIYDLNKYRRKSLEKAAEPHSHSYYQIIWFFNCGGVHTVDFKTYQIKENTILFISKDQVHAFDENLAIKGWLIHFNESFFMHSDVDIFLKYNIFNSQQRPCYAIDTETVEMATSYIDLIHKEITRKHRFGYQDVIRFLLKSLLINLERVHQKDATKALEPNNLYELQFFKFKELVEDNYMRGYSVNKYADMLNISSKTLATITKTVVGKSPSQLIAERVVLEARRLLKFTTLQISEITFRLGFEDTSYFIKYFKRHVGSSPRHYRMSLSG